MVDNRRYNLGHRLNRKDDSLSKYKPKTVGGLPPHGLNNDII